VRRKPDGASCRRPAPVPVPGRRRPGPWSPSSPPRRSRPPPDLAAADLLDHVGVRGRRLVDRGLKRRIVARGRQSWLRPSSWPRPYRAGTKARRPRSRAARPHHAVLRRNAGTAGGQRSGDVSTRAARGFRGCRTRDPQALLASEPMPGGHQTEATGP